MTGKKLFCAALSLAAFALPVRAQWVVSDPTSYIYYVEQLKQQAETVSQAMKQVETMGGVLTEATAIKNQMMGHYNRAQNLVYRMQRVQAAFEADGGNGIFSNARKWGNVGRAVDGVTSGPGIGNVDNILGEELFKDTKRILDEVFGDPRNMTAQEKYRAADRKYQIRQDALKGVAARSEELLGDTKNRLNTIQELANAINTTTNMKDAQDLSNRILVEILASLNSLIQITAAAQQADAILKYSGSTDAGMARRKTRLESPTTSDGSGLEGLLNKAEKMNTPRFNLK